MALNYFPVSWIPAFQGSCSCGCSFGPVTDMNEAGWVVRIRSCGRLKTLRRRWSLRPLFQRTFFPRFLAAPGVKSVMLSRRSPAVGCHFKPHGYQRCPFILVQLKKDWETVHSYTLVRGDAIPRGVAADKASPVNQPVQTQHIGANIAAPTPMVCLLVMLMQHILYGCKFLPAC